MKPPATKGKVTKTPDIAIMFITHSAMLLKMLKPRLVVQLCWRVLLETVISGIVSVLTIELSSMFADTPLVYGASYV